MEVDDPRTQSENDLSDMNDFCGPIANGVHSEQFEGVRIEDQFQQAPGHLPASGPWPVPHSEPNPLHS